MYKRQVLNLGNIKGADGLGITKAEINTSGELVLTYANGDVKNLGKVSGENGKDGVNGAEMCIRDSVIAALMHNDFLYKLT